MKAAMGWVALFLMGYVLVALFFLARGAKRAVGMASASGPLQAEAKAIAAKNNRAQVLWVKRHRAQLPPEARTLAARVAALDLSCWIAFAALVVLYGLSFVAS